ncbi:hypothetical protein [Deinococcus taeanensis]|nr:hypothetical protein [Deinococcus taeanensis]
MRKTTRPLAGQVEPQCMPGSQAVKPQTALEDQALVTPLEEGLA